MATMTVEAPAAKEIQSLGSYKEFTPSLINYKKAVEEEQAAVRVPYPPFWRDGTPGFSFKLQAPDWAPVAHASCFMLHSIPTTFRPGTQTRNIRR